MGTQSLSVRRGRRADNEADRALVNQGFGRIVHLLLGGWLSLLLSLPWPCAWAQGNSAGNPSYRTRVVGVFDGSTGAPLDAVDVVDMLSGNSVRTTSTGTASLAFLPDGATLLRITKIGYVPITVPISIRPMDTLPLTLMLGRVAQLPAVITRDSMRRYTSPQLRAFDERRLASPAGYFLSEAEIRRVEDNRLGDVLKQRFPGIMIVPGKHGGTHLRRSNRCSAGEDPDVYLDGVLQALPKPVDLTEFLLSDLSGVEYYPSTGTAPSEFNRTSKACGALLLWSRQ